WIVMSTVGAVVVVLGAGGTWFAVSQLQSSGADSPTAAEERLTTSIADGDMVGALETLPPAEADLIIDTVGDYTAELDRLGIFESGVDVDSLDDVMNVESSDLQFDSDDVEQVNDHLSVVPLSSGTLTITADPEDVPFTDEFFDAITDGEFSKGNAETQTTTVDAEELQRMGTP